ncbi:MAG: dTDP-glucose 4,6-dehydratase [Nitrospirae bacterium]|jgi:dTDP-glucose 4,6-dehydratase|nr:dTDP-glucose 4,6-dehydratase [Nitrospirota bacterium]
MERWLVTGGAGFIGSNFVLAARREKRAEILNLDRLTYAGNPANLEGLKSDSSYRLLQGDIADRELVRKALSDFSPTAVFHFAAESHVDRSIEGPAIFLRTNVEGTFVLLEESRRYRDSLPPDRKSRFRFVHVSTDEVFGSLSATDPPFSERTPYAPNSPYAASKAASDHFVRAWFHTYGLPVVTTNCSNNYGPFQFPEKLVPTVILSALKGKDVPVYGDGMNVRDWLYVEDHCDALFRVHERGIPGETYNIGGGNERTNIEMVSSLLALLDRKKPRPDGSSHRERIRFVADRPGHDRRYAIDGSRLRRELSWTPSHAFDRAIEKTVDWYLHNVAWWTALESRHEAGTRQGLIPGEEAGTGGGP